MSHIKPKSGWYGLPVDTQIVVEKPEKSEILLVTEERRSSVKVRNLVTKDEEEYSKNDLYALWKEQRATFLSPYHSTTAFVAESGAKILASFEALPPEVKRRALIREGLMRAFEGIVREDGELRNDVLQTLSRQAQSEHPGMQGLSRSSLRYYWKRWVESAGSIMCLVDRPPRQRKFKPRFADQVVKIFKEIIDKHYKRSHRPDQSEIYEVFEQAIAEFNGARGPDLALPCPSLKTFRRWIGQENKYDVAAARHGEVYARKHFGAMGPGERATRPLQIVQVDHTPLDIGLVSDVTGLPCSRAWLTVLIDVHTRCIIGFHISFNPPSYVSVARALEHAIRDKDYVSKRHPGVKNDWPCRGLPERLALDNAPEFHSEDFKYNCALLGIRLEYVEARRPHLKGIVERVQWTLNRLLQNMPSTTFSNALEKGDFDPSKFAYAMLSDLDYALHRFIVDVYHQRLHRGINAIPHKVWMDGIEEYAPRLPENIGALKVILGQRETRKLHDYGIDLFGIRYFSYEIEGIRSDPGFAKDGKVEVRHNGDDVSEIQVRHPDGQYVRLPAIDEEVLKGVSLFQYRFLRKLARQKVESEVKAAEIADAKEDIRRALGFYSSRRKRRYSRNETRMLSAFNKGSAEGTAGRADVKRNDKPPISKRPDVDPLQHRNDSGAGWSSARRPKSI